MKKLQVGIVGLLAFMPFAASAQTDAESILESLGTLINLATPIVVALALLFFFWGLATFILSAGNEEKRKEGRGIMIWGIIALFIIVSIWGLIRVVQETFNLETSTTIEVPGVKIR